MPATFWATCTHVQLKIRKTPLTQFSLTLRTLSKQMLWLVKFVPRRPLFMALYDFICEFMEIISNIIHEG